MNLSKIATKDICQNCGRCCKSFSEIIYNFDHALRLSLLDTDKIKVKEFKLSNGGKCWRITYDFPCSKLKKGRDGKYYCELYGNKETPRPWMCKVYPDNQTIEDIDIEKNYCPALKKLEALNIITANTITEDKKEIGSLN